MRVALLTTGSELLDGRVTNSNATFIGGQLEALGAKLKFILSCDDDREEFLKSLAFLAREVEVILISGGLGPTTDDLTREVVSDFLKVPLVEDPLALESIKTWYEARHRELNEANRIQALIPKGASVILNPYGSAPGFMTRFNAEEKKEVSIIALPGVPRELKGMFVDSVLREITPPQALPDYQEFWRLFGIPESEVSKIATPIISSFVNEKATLKVSYRASFPEVHLTLKSHDLIPKSLCVKLSQAFGSNVVNRQPEINFPAYILELLKDKNTDLFLVESCTGGEVSSLLTKVAGASECYLGGMITYANSLKEKLGVPAGIIEKFGSVSKECAKEMAEKGLLLAQSLNHVGTNSSQPHSRSHPPSKKILALSLSGIAGPNGGTPAKPVGTFFLALAIQDRPTLSLKDFFNGSREQIRIFAAYKGLDLIRKALLVESEEEEDSEDDRGRE